VAAGARKHRSSLAGRSGLFVVNNLAIASGRNLDRITQAETIHLFVGLSQNLAKLTAAQYLIELTLIQALAAQPQEELFLVIVEHLLRLNNAPPDLPIVMALLNHGIYHLLAVAGLAPQVHHCCISKATIQPDLRVSSSDRGGSNANVPDSNFGGNHQPTATDPKYRPRRSVPRFGFSIIHGGLVKLESALANGGYNSTIDRDRNVLNLRHHDRPNRAINGTNAIKHKLKVSHHLTNHELEALQLLPQAELSAPISHLDTSVWLSIERLLRAYTKYHFDKPIQSADLIDSCFNPL
jgi:DNA repair protein RecO (recombination protein O)